ncbi:MAG: carbamoyltransferase C-terminal domain-containing protein [Candidatus Omnitrophota bacterium]|jgi:carbamoyltransferase
MPVYILGIAVYQRDSSAALLKDGELLCCFEEDKVKGIKQKRLFPENAVKLSLEFAGISIMDISFIMVNHSPAEGFCPEYLRHFINPRLFKHLLDRAVYFGSFYQLLKNDLTRIFPAEIKCILPKIKFLSHHLAHAASSYFLSPFDDAAIFTADGCGESTSVMYARAKGPVITKIKELKFPYSLGSLYSAMTEYLGFKPNSDEGTVMALASYGDDSLYNSFKKIIFLKENGTLGIDPGYFSFYNEAGRKWTKKLCRELGPCRAKDGIITKQHMNIAGALQHELEDTVILMLQYLKNQTGSDNLCLAGGVFLNCTLNSIIKKKGIFSHVFIHPAVNDAGTAYGAALFKHYEINGLGKRNIENACFTPYLGTEYDDNAIKSVLERSEVNFSLNNNVVKTGARLLAEGKIIGWFQGRSETGPRALGNRSLLANPLQKGVRDHINSKIKNREWFRPFAPSVLAEYAHDYFEGNCSSEYMLYSIKAKADKIEHVGECCHVDGTCRLQTVTRESNNLFYALIKEFNALTGLPMLLNTSLNLRGKPIVSSPQQAVEMFKRVPLDALIIGNYVLMKR